MLAVVIISIMVVLITLGGIAHKHAVTDKSLSSAETPALNSTRGLTRPAKELYKEYMALPEDSRPFPEIIPILKAMDAKTSNNHVGLRRHFDNNWLPNIRSQNGGVDFSWTPYRQHCSRHYCDFIDYHNLHARIKEVADSLAEKERAILLAANQGGLDMLKELENSLRSEANIQKQVTREITGEPEMKSVGNGYYHQDRSGNIVGFYMQ